MALLGYLCKIYASSFFLFYTIFIIILQQLVIIMLPHNYIGSSQYSSLNECTVMNNKKCYTAHIECTHMKFSIFIPASQLTLHHVVDVKEFMF